MSRMTPADIRSAVRSVMDLDATDLPDAIINLYMRDGYQHIINLERRWRFLEHSFSFNSVVGQRSYNIDLITAQPLREIISIVVNDSTGNRLELVSFDEAESRYTGALDTPNRPLFYAVWQDQIHLFPKPDIAYPLTVRAYRDPIDWVTGNTYVDAAESLHFPIVYYIVSRVYQTQENAPMAQMYKQSFDESVSIARKDLTRPDSAAPLVLSGGKTGRRTQKGWLQALGHTLGS